MAHPSDRERVAHIVEAIDWITEFVDALDFDTFQQDHKTRLSIERLLEIIGEAANHLSDEVKDSYPTIPWRQITDLRNVISHAYFQIRLEIIWGVAINEIPPLRGQIQQILLELDAQSAKT